MPVSPTMREICIRRRSGKQIVIFLGVQVPAFEMHTTNQLHSTVKLVRHNTSRAAGIGKGWLGSSRRQAPMSLGFFFSPPNNRCESLLPRLLQKRPCACTFFRLFSEPRRLLITFSPFVYAALPAFSGLRCFRFAEALTTTAPLSNRRLIPTQIVSTHRHPHILNDLPPPAEFIR